MIPPSPKAGIADAKTLFDHRPLSSHVSPTFLCSEFHSTPHCWEPNLPSIVILPKHISDSEKDHMNTAFMTESNWLVDHLFATTDFWFMFSQLTCKIPSCSPMHCSASCRPPPWSTASYVCNVQSLLTEKVQQQVGPN